MQHVDELAGTLAYLATRQLRDFGAPDGQVEDLSKFSQVDSRLDNNFAPMSDLLRLALLSRGARDRPIPEKTLWEVEFTFKTIPCALAHRKNGIKLTLQIPKDTKVPAQSISGEIANKLRSAVKNMQERVVEPRIAEQRKLNNIRIINQHDRYSGFVSYFRQKLNAILSGEKASGADSVRLQVSGHPKGDQDLVRDMERLLGGMRDEIARQHEIAYLATALLAGYFSLIQHRLVLLTGFSPRAKEPDFSVDDLLAAHWSDQFSAATKGISSDSGEVAYNDISYLAKTYRNSLLHGGGGRLADGIFVEWAPGYHSTVTERGEFTDQFMLWQPAVTSREAEDILAKIDRIESWFHSLPYFPWLEAGLPVSFDRRSIETALQHLQDGTTEAHIEQEDIRFDRDINFER